jgi:hypothetical protein
MFYGADVSLIPGPLALVQPISGSLADVICTGAYHAGLSYIPPPKPKLPGHNESYNPAPEYVPTEEERAAYDMMDKEDKPDFIPQSFDAMRKVRDPCAATVRWKGPSHVRVGRLLTALVRH